MTSISARWATTYTAALVFGQGCGGSNVKSIVLMPEARSRGELEAAWANARDARREAVKAYELGHPCPEIMYTNVPWTHATWGEERRARAERDAQRKAFFSESEEAGDGAEEQSWKSSGLVVTAPYPSGGIGGFISANGLDWQDDPVSGPLAVLHEKGCRCRCGSTYYADFAEPTDLAGLAALTKADDRLYVSFADVDGTFAKYVTNEKKFSELFAEAELARSRKIAAEAQAYEDRVWFLTVTPEQVDAMGEEEYKKWSGLQPMGMSQVGWHQRGSWEPYRRDGDWEQAGAQEARRLLGRAGLHEVRPVELTWWDDLN